MALESSASRGVKVTKEEFAKYASMLKNKYANAGKKKGVKGKDRTAEVLEEVPADEMNLG